MAIGVIARYAHAEPSSPPRGANREMMMGRVLAFGEIMLRLSPPNRELLLQTPHLDVWTAGAEANVATALALLGHDVAFATALPHNALGAAPLQSLRGHAADCPPVLPPPGRMGPYF